MQHNNQPSPKRSISNTSKKPLDIKLDHLVRAVATLRAESTAAEEELAALQDDQSKIKALLNSMGDQI